VTAVWCLGREGSVCPVVLLPDLFGILRHTLSARRGNNSIPSKIPHLYERALPEAVGTEGVPARELDRICPLAQTDAALVYASVHWFLVRGQIRRATAS